MLPLNKFYFQVSLSFSHQIGTRVGLSLMKSISKRQKERDPNATCSVSAFTACPLLRYCISFLDINIFLIASKTIMRNLGNLLRYCVLKLNRIPFLNAYRVIRHKVVFGHTFPFLMIPIFRSGSFICERCKASFNRQLNCT